MWNVSKGRFAGGRVEKMAGTFIIYSASTLCPELHIGRSSGQSLVDLSLASHSGQPPTDAFPDLTLVSNLLLLQL